MSLIQHPLILSGKNIRLIPMEESLFDQAWAVACDPRIWEFTSLKLFHKEPFYKHLQEALQKRLTGEKYQFAIIGVHSGELIGSTMFHSISPENYKLEIGWTWFAPAYWRSGYNREVKLLMLTYCFETLKMKRVQFQTDEVNLRSQKALLGIGAKFEGLLRHERMRPDGTCRNTPMFSIIDTEWEEVKQALIEKIERIC